MNEPEIALWRAVIVQAAADAGTMANRSSRGVDKLRAVSWIRTKSKDFAEVCAHANLDAAYVHETLNKLIDEGNLDGRF